MKIGICNEMFGDWDQPRIFSFVHSLGYEGIEIAPFKLADSVTQISGETRRQLRNLAQKNKLEIIGTHWLLVKPEGLSISTREAEVRRRTSEYLTQLVVFTREIGGQIMVLGSPKQRSLAEGQTYEEVKGYLKEVLQPVLEEAGRSQVTVCLEPLGRKETNFINTGQQAVEIIREINHSNLKLILDVKAMSDENRPLPEIIDSGAGHLKHFHANDANLLGPGFGAVDFGPIISKLKEMGYNRWVSVEVFDFTPGPEAIAEKSIEYLRKFM